MKTCSPQPFRSRRGSALLTVVMLTAVMATLTASMLTYTMSERRGNERNRLIMRAKNAAENICIYGAEQITTKLYRVRSTSPMAFIGGSNQVNMPPVDVLQAANKNYTSGSAMELFAGLTTATGLLFIDPATSPNDPNAGLQVNTATVPVISKSTAWHPSLGTVSSYARQDLAVDFVPLFQFGVFYNMDLEVWPGANMTLAGPVHANGEINARSAPGFTATIAFLDRVSTSKGFYADANKQGDSIQSSGAIMSGVGGDAPVTFKHTTTGTVTAIKSSTNVWRDHKYGTTTETTTTQNNFKVFATNTYAINLRTRVHGVTDLVLPAVTGYAETDNPSTTEDERDNGRQIIERPVAGESGALSELKISRRAGLYIVVNPDDEIRDGYKPDGTTLTMLPRTYRCFLNTVNSDLTHTITEVVLPGQPAYGYDNNGTPGVGADGDDFMYVNNLPNRYVTTTAIGHNQVLRMLQPAYTQVKRYNGSAWVDTDATTLPNGAGYTTGSPTMTSFTDGYFYDMRRAKNNSGLAALGASGSFRSSNNYTPRPIAKIDFDLTRFRMCVERTLSGTSGNYAASDTAATIYDVNTPAAANWTNSIFNSAGTAASKGLGLVSAAFTTLPTATTLTAQDPYRMYFAPVDPTASAAATQIATDPSYYAVGGTDLVSSTLTKPWYDGITIYIQSVDAEVRALTSGVPNRIDSGVRLWNGRGPIVSFDGSTYPNKTGFTFCTNDAAYIIGHFNADGTINTTTSSTGSGGYSARYPDTTAEKLCAVMADAITLLSQPLYSSATTPYSQTSGWTDSLSAHRTGSTWTSTWASTQPSSSNGSDGVNTSMRPAAMPWMGNTPGTAGTAIAQKLDGSTTEISSALMVGIVPTNHNPTGLTDGPPSTGANGQVSGGLHNFPRLLEVWGSAGLYIRGSMVAMFESRVAMETWTQRVYSAPARTWGLHESLRNANHDLPLEPVLLGARRLGFKEITASEYATMKATIEALPH
jgi:hypothetical protein